jgi:putative hydrolase of the HAD superfamily
MKYKHLFFDLDRTLWDFDKNSKLALFEIFEEINWAGLVKPNAERFVTTYQEINEECWVMYRKGEIDKDTLRVIRFRRSLAHYDLTDADLADRLGDMYIEISPRKTNLIDGAIEILDYLKSKGYQMHIITNGFSEVQDIKLDNCGLAKFFGQVVTSEHVGKKKPDPDVFAYALNKAAAEVDHSLMIGDDHAVDIVGAQNVGMDQVYFNPRNKQSLLATYEIGNLRELREIL